mgnify:CR=1 FL=1
MQLTPIKHTRGIRYAKLTINLPNLSVVIPTLNEADTLQNCLESLKEAPGEIILVDGGSTDDTISIAKKNNCRALVTTPGRGEQLAVGAEASTKTWMLFLHADTILDEGWQNNVGAFMELSCNQNKAAAFTYRVDLRSLSARVMEKWVMMRSNLGMTYGDQGLLINRKHYHEIGGYKKLPLMEDVDLCLRIGLRNISVINSSAVTSGRRYKNSWIFIRGLRNFICMIFFIKL